MKYRSSAWGYKLLAWLLIAVCIAFGTLSAFVTGYCLSENYYDEDTKFQTTYHCSEMVRRHSNEIIHQYHRKSDEANWQRLLEGSDLRFIILDEATGEVVESYTEGMYIKVPKNMKDNAFLYEYNYNMRLGDFDTPLENVYVCDYYFGLDASGNLWQGSNSFRNDGNWYSAEDAQAMIEGTSYQVLFLLPQNLHRYYDDYIGQAYRIYLEFQWWSSRTPVIFGLCVVGLLAAVIFLCIQTGRRPGKEKLQGTFVEKIPFEILLGVGVLAFFGFVGCIVLLADMRISHLTIQQFYLAVSLCGAGAAACGLFLVELLLTFILRLKLHCFIRSTLSFYILRFCWRMLCWLGRKTKGLWMIAVKGFRSIGMVPRAAALVLGVFFVELVLFIWLVNAYYAVIPIFFLLFFNLFLLLALLWLAGQMNILKKSGKAMADGDLEHQIDTHYMYWDFKEHGENLNAIAGGMTKAVEKQMKSERLKTELITNVSHDIKTPLTSIVNYVDLLQKPHSEAEQVQYLEVLDRQAKRLKRLTENLVEASKASTGNMPVTLEETNVRELLNQAIEEYRQRLEAGKLEVILDLPEDLTVMADGKLLWRVLDNLLNNVIKYAMAGTRVYVSGRRDGTQAVLAVKNISREPLNMDAEELMERFVRGDSSRHTEGSGLGLNIARSLVTLQKGRFELTVDGDFFKAEIILPLV